MTRRHVVLFLWVLGILLPMAWFTQFSPRYARIFALLFGPLWVHLLMHALLFAILGFLAARLLQQGFPAVTWASVPAALIAVVLIAVLQEGIQLLYKGRALGADEVLDVAVDSVAGGLGAIAFWWRRRA